MNDIKLIQLIEELYSIELTAHQKHQIILLIEKYPSLWNYITKYKPIDKAIKLFFTENTPVFSDITRSISPTIEREMKQAMDLYGLDYLLYRGFTIATVMEVSKKRQESRRVLDKLEEYIDFSEAKRTIKNSKLRKN
ncbi:hypothetical protein ACMXYX_04935 [Neptuniibacter sp. QD72_48]|uniref:hypothetical protein n=1 Tax=Neptuniibacter sp. QD72_48 TaxID=3398214 RepID=UPI0039F4B1D8